MLLGTGEVERMTLKHWDEPGMWMSCQEYMSYWNMDISLKIGAVMEEKESLT